MNVLCGTTLSSFYSKRCSLHSVLYIYTHRRINLLWEILFNYIPLKKKKLYIFFVLYISLLNFTHVHWKRENFFFVVEIYEKIRDDAPSTFSATTTFKKLHIKFFSFFCVLLYFKVKERKKKMLKLIFWKNMLNKADTTHIRVVFHELKRKNERQAKLFII